MVEVLRENWEFILYERNEAFYLFIVNGQGSLSDVTYKLNAQEEKAFRSEGPSFLVKKVKAIRCSLRQAPRLHFSEAPILD